MYPITLHCAVALTLTAQLHRPRVPGDWRHHPVLGRVQPGGGLFGAADGITRAFVSPAATFSHRKGKLQGFV